MNLTRRALALACAVSIGACSPTPAPTPVPTLQATSIPSTTAAPSAAASQEPAETPAPATAAERDWARITSAEQPALGDRIGTVGLVAVAARRPELVAVGSIAATGAAAWYSPDGYTWSRASFPDPGTAELNDVIAMPNGYVAVGSRSSGQTPVAAAWTSTDGRTWVLARIADGQGATLRRLASGGPGLVAQGGYDNGGLDQVAVWGSADGSDWTVLAPRGALSGQAEVTAIGSGPQGLVILGSVFESAWSPAAWHSSDGRTWERGRTPDSGGMNDVTLFGSRLVAVGSTDPGQGDPAAWYSDDGVSWSAAPPLPGGANGQRDVNLSAVALGGRGLVAVGPSAEGTAGVWESVDGIAWIALPNGTGLDSAPELYGTYQPTDVVAGGPGIVAVGSFPGPDWLHIWSGAVWTSPAPGVAVAPSPTPLTCPNPTHPAAADVIDLSPPDHLACFSSRTVRFTAYVSTCCDEGLQPASWLTADSPYWLCPAGGGACPFAGVVSMAAYRDRSAPKPHLTGAPAGDWFVVTGHFDDPRAASCVPAGTDQTAQQAVLECRERFVMTGLAPTHAP